MKIYSISVIKNEEDVIAYSLEQASKWSDKIFVLDNGSSDRTWEIVQQLAKTNDKIIPWKQLSVPFYEGLRGEVYNEFKHLSEEGDWWCFRLDADEFYVDNPVDFLKNIPEGYHYVCKDSIEYYLTHDDLANIDFSKDFRHRIDDIRYYHPQSYREARFFRFRRRLEWDTQLPFPKHMGIVYPKLIRCKHYQYRSPEQIQNRLDIRQMAIKSGFQGWNHASQKSYLDKVMLADELIYDDFSGKYYNTESVNEYLHSPLRLLIKRILHGLKILP